MFKIKIVTNNLCTFCNLEVENIMHLFWYCPHTQEIIKFVVDIVLRSRPSIPIHITCQDLVLGIINPKMNDLNIVFLELKRYIFYCQRKNRFVISMKQSFEIYRNTNKSEEELKIWSLVKIFTDISYNDITNHNT